MNTYKKNYYFFPETVLDAMQNHETDKLKQFMNTNNKVND